MPNRCIWHLHIEFDRARQIKLYTAFPVRHTVPSCSRIYLMAKRTNLLQVQSYTKITTNTVYFIQTLFRQSTF